MVNNIELCSDVDLIDFEEEIFDTLKGEDIDYILTRRIIINDVQNFVMEISSQSNLPIESISKSLCKWIIKCYEPFLLKKMIQIYFNEFDFDIQSILTAASEKNRNFLDDTNNIVEKLTNYFMTENFIIIDGFIRFRLSEYRQAVYDNLCEAIEEFYIEKEYEDFISLLTDYIEYKMPLVDLLHIKSEINGEFKLYDFKKNKIDINIENNLVQDSIEFFLTKDDMLLSILIALAPRRIIWHKTNCVRNSNLLNTVKSVFGERFSICYGCDFCNDEYE